MFLTAKVPLLLGERKECSASPLLFNIALKVLGSRIMLQGEVKGIQIEKDVKLC